MKYLFFILTIFTMSCKAQTVSLEEAAQCNVNPSCPDYTYAKDINNSLNKYLGTWIGSKNGKTYEFQFKKGLYQNLSLSDTKRDRLIGRLRIKDSNGIVVYDTFSEPDDEKTNFMGLNFQPNLQAYMMYFSGPSLGCNEFGTIYLVVKPTTPNQMMVLMLQDNDIAIGGECPPTFEPIVPYKTSINLIKQ